jgi:hypothetical protein
VAERGCYECEATSAMPRCAVSVRIAGAQLGNADAELLAYDHDLAASDAAAVGVDLHGLRSAALQFEDLAGTQGENLADGQWDTAHFHTDVDLHVQQEVGGV